MDYMLATVDAKRNGLTTIGATLGIRFGQAMKSLENAMTGTGFQIDSGWNTRQYSSLTSVRPQTLAK